MTIRNSIMQRSIIVIARSIDECTMIQQQCSDVNMSMVTALMLKHKYINMYKSIDIITCVILYAYK